MDLEIFKKAILINEEIEGAENNKATIYKLYSKKEELEPLEIERLFAIATNSICFKIDTLKNDLKKL